MKYALAFLAVSLFSAAAMASGQTKLVYPANESASDVRYNDLVEILRTALEKTADDFGPYRLEKSPVGMNEVRSLLELHNPRGMVNVAWGGTSEQREADFTPIRIPLRKGILGYRIALISQDRQPEVDKIHNLQDLKKYSVGQGNGWGDVSVYELNGIKVRMASYESLFKMVAAGRFDLFPRGISEVFPEYALRHKEIPNLAIEKNLLIYYPWPYYFFFNKSNKPLANRIEVGIRRMIADGSFDEIFRKYNAASIERANLKKRRVIRLANPLLPKATPLDDDSLWFDPAKWK